MWTLGQDVAFQGLDCPLSHRIRQACTVFRAYPHLWPSCHSPALEGAGQGSRALYFPDGEIKEQRSLATPQQGADVHGGPAQGKLRMRGSLTGSWEVGDRR